MEQESKQRAGKGDYRAVVVSNRQIGVTFWKVLLEFSGAGAEAFGEFRPGQFAQVDVSGGRMRRSGRFCCGGLLALRMWRGTARG